MSKLEKQQVWAPMPPTTRAAAAVINMGDFKGTKKIIYGSDKTVVMRGYDSPSECTLYTQHTHHVCSAALSPSGFYMASADKGGKVRIWDAVGDEQILKNEFTPMSGPINDLRWDAESKRIVVVGDGKTKFGSVFLVDTGSSVGDINMGKQGTSADFKKDRPFKLATGSDDMCVSIYAGPPFKKPIEIKQHTRFVNQVRYAPNGQLLASCSSDATIILYDGASGEVKAKLDGHKGSVTGVSWSYDGKKLISVSVDGTAKVWDTETFSLLRTIDVKPADLDLNNSKNLISYQLLACYWSADAKALALQNGGALLELDIESGKVVARIDGHSKTITALVSGFSSSTNPQTKSPYLFSSDYVGGILAWNPQTGNAYRLKQARQVQINSIVLLNDGSLAVAYLDGKLAILSAEEIKTAVDAARLPFRSAEAVDGLIVNWNHSDDHLISLPCDLPNTAVSLPGNRSLLVAGFKGLDCIQNGIVAFSIPFEKQITKMALLGENQLLLGLDGGKLQLYTSAVKFNALSNASQLTLANEISIQSNATAIAVSEDQTRIALALSSRHVELYDASTLSLLAQSTTHTARATCVIFKSGSNSVTISGSLDGSINVWDTVVNKPKLCRESHKGGVTCLVQMDANTLISAGFDCAVTKWKV